MSKGSTRLDQALVERGLALSRAMAQELIGSGQVLVNGSTAEKAARRIFRSDQLAVAKKNRFVGRGGEKLEGALDEFGLTPAGWTCMDIGSSTGGFVDCLLQRGAELVVAIDVGRAQLDSRLRSDQRVLVLEQTDIRGFVPVDPVPKSYDLVTADLSFISIRSVVDDLYRICRPNSHCHLVLLVKPQFEVGHRDASRAKGVIKDPSLWGSVLLDAAELLRGVGFRVGGMTPSRLRGAAGNQEFFICATVDTVETIDHFSFDALVDSAVAAVPNRP